MHTHSDHFLDSGAARMLAGLIALLALVAIALVWLNASRIDPSGRPLASAPRIESEPSANPAFTECSTKRTAEVDRMLSEGLINADQHSKYREQAIATCAGQFPPNRSN